MVVIISLSTTSQKIFQKIEKQKNEDLKNHCDCFFYRTYLLPKEILWLIQSSPELTGSARPLFDELRTSLLSDFCEARNLLPSKKKTKGLKGKILWGITALAGTIFFAAEGFDGMAVMLSITGLPILPLFLVSILFSLASVGIFYFVEFTDVSKSLDVKLFSMPRLLNANLKEMYLLRKLRKDIRRNVNSNLALQEENLILLQMIEMRFDALDKARLVLLKALHSRKITVAKVVIFSLQSTMFFGAGFFAGQTVAIMVATLILGSISPTFWPIILASLVGGFAGLVVFWAFQRPALETFIDRCMGLNRERIKKYCSFDHALAERHEIRALKENIESVIELGIEREHLLAGKDFFKKNKFSEGENLLDERDSDFSLSS